MSLRWGAWPNSASAWNFSLWAPEAGSVAVDFDSRRHPLSRDGEGWWTATLGAEAGAAYRFVVDGKSYPDPASRLQSGDVHGPSLLVDHSTYNWKTQWTGRPWAEAVLYELHVGTFTPEGTFAAAAEKLADLAELGITAIEIMPVGQFPGHRGWGYDGVLPYAPQPDYGTPDDLKALVDQAHSVGLMVILDLVMNHFGPEGSYIHGIAPPFFDPERHTPWGAAIEFSQDAVRRFWIDCGAMWLTDYRFDGLRLDAVHQITGPGAEEFMRQFSRGLRALPLGRPIHLITEDERNEPALREEGPYEASWNDDFHHAVHTALTGEGKSYYASFAVDPIGDLALALARGHIEEGQERPRLETLRGKPSGHLQPTAFVNSTQTHDQVGNRALGERLLSLAEPDAVAIAYALLLVAPYTPMIFMGEERGETAPFQFFGDYGGELGDLIRQGRAAEFPEFSEHGDKVPDPLAETTFTVSRLNWDDGPDARRWLALTRQSLGFRHAHVVPLLNSGRIAPGRAEPTGERSLEAEWQFAAGTLRLAMNLGAVGTLPRPLPAPQLVLGDLQRDAYALQAQVTLS